MPALESEELLTEILYSRTHWFSSRRARVMTPIILVTSPKSIWSQGDLSKSLGVHAVMDSSWGKRRAEEPHSSALQMHFPESMS